MKKSKLLSILLSITMGSMILWGCGSSDTAGSAPTTETASTKEASTSKDAGAAAGTDTAAAENNDALASLPATLADGVVDATP